jgi:hypothetical protein
MVKIRKNNFSERGFKSLEGNVGQILKPVFANKKDDFLVITNFNKNWQQIVGEKCYQFCFPKKVKFEKNKKSNGVLTIGATNSSIAFYLEASTNQIIENIASYYGYKIISEIRIIQEPKILEEKMEKIMIPTSDHNQNLIANLTLPVKDLELKSILQKLGQSILK